MPNWLEKEEENCSYMCVCSVVSLQCHGLYVACQAPLSIGFSRQEYWRDFPFPPLGDLPDPRIEPVSPALDYLYHSHHQRIPLFNPYKPLKINREGLVRGLVGFGLFLEPHFRSCKDYICKTRIILFGFVQYIGLEKKCLSSWVE